MDKFNANVYHDGSHYIWVNHGKTKTKTTRAPSQRRTEEEILFDGVLDKLQKNIDLEGHGDVDMSNGIAGDINFDLDGAKKVIIDNLFLQKESQIALVLPYIENYEIAKAFVEFARARAYKAYRKRLDNVMKKVGVNQFNYFCTFTYDDDKHTEETFKKKLSNCLNHFASRNGWKYIGVWEHSPVKNRLHVHALMYIPDGTMPAELIEVTDYSTSRHKQVTSIRNTYFNERFGLSHFQKIDDLNDYEKMVQYILKYIGKTGNKLFMSRGLPSYKTVKINLDDVAYQFGEFGQYNVLFDESIQE